MQKLQKLYEDLKQLQNKYNTTPQDGPLNMLMRCHFCGSAVKNKDAITGFDCDGLEVPLCSVSCHNGLIDSMKWNHVASYYKHQNQCLCKFCQNN